MARPTANTGTLPEFLTSPSVGDFFAGWLDEQIEALDRRSREEGSNRAIAWELRTLRRAHVQLSSLLASGEED